MALIADAIPFVPGDPVFFGVSVDSVLCGLTLIGVAVFHRYTVRVALIFTGFKSDVGLPRFVSHLLCLLLGFVFLRAILKKVISRSVLCWHPEPMELHRQGSPGRGVNQIACYKQAR
jgi:hypothetical protein